MTLLELITAIQNDLRDPDARTFSVSSVESMAAAGLSEVGRVSPRRFQEDLDPVADQFEYQLLTADFTDPVPEIEVARVELWDMSQSPPMPTMRVQPYDSEYIAYSDAGWKVWEGILELPRDVVVYLNEDVDNRLIRVWGYSPYVNLGTIGEDDSDVVPLSEERLWTLRAYVRVAALTRLVNERDLFSQWQASSGNTDMSPAALMSGLRDARDEWRDRSRAIAVLREAP